MVETEVIMMARGTIYIYGIRTICGMANRSNDECEPILAKIQGIAKFPIKPPPKYSDKIVDNSLTVKRPTGESPDCNTK